MNSESIYMGSFPKPWSSLNFKEVGKRKPPIESYKELLVTKQRSVLFTEDS